MQQISTLAGSGWLRTRSFGSSTAQYRLHVVRDDDGQLSGFGTVETEYVTLIEARAPSHATLVLDDHRTVTISIIDLSDNVGAFRVIGRVPGG